MKERLTSIGIAIAACLCVIALAACSTKQGSDPISTSFDGESGSAVLVMGATSRNYKNQYSLYFVGYDPEKNLLYSERNGKDINLFIGQTSSLILPRQVAHPFEGKDYYVKRIEPGSYYVFAASAGHYSSLGEVLEGSWMFTVNPGEVTYVGDFTIDRSRILYNFNLEGAKQALKNYKNITAELTERRVKKVTLECDRGFMGIGDECFVEGRPPAFTRIL